MSVELRRSDNRSTDLRGLIQQLDQELAVTDGEEHSFYHQFNGIESIDHFILAYIDDIPVACGAFKKDTDHQVEIKRMYTLSAYRSKGIASQILKALEAWAYEESFKKVILETGKRQLAAIQLYKKNGYHQIDNYGQYAGMENSVCFAKLLP